ncbi:MAG: hypothetical protein AAGA87_15430 [Pseudomonadota bacterium]
MDTRDKVFELLVELSDYTHEDGLVLVSRKLEEALDAFLAETGQISGADAGAEMTRGSTRRLARARAVQAATSRVQVRSGLR